MTVKEKIQARLREKGAHFSVPKRKQPEPHKPVGTIFRLTSKCIFVFCCKWEIRFSLSFVVKIIAIRQNWKVLVSTSGLYTIISVFNYVLTTAITSFSRIYVYQLKNFRFAFQILGKPFSRYVILTEGESEGNALFKYSNRGTKLFPGNEVLYWKNFFFVSIDFANAVSFHEIYVLEFSSHSFKFCKLKYQTMRFFLLLKKKMYYLSRFFPRAHQLMQWRSLLLELRESKHYETYETKQNLST